MNKRLSVFIVAFVLLAAVFCPYAFVTGDVAYADEVVYLGGKSIGIVAKTEGVIVTAVIDVVTKDGLVAPARNSGVLPGDVISEIDGKPVHNEADVASTVKGKDEVTAKILRAGSYVFVKMPTALDAISNTLKLGMLIKTDINGVGTLTFIRKDNLRFGALGHPIADGELPLKYEFNSGIICKSTVVGVIRGEDGKAGAIRGRIDRSVVLGEIDKNNAFGIYGKALPRATEGLSTVSVAGRDEVRMGGAEILTTLENGDPKRYSIEIIKTEKQSSPEGKSMVIRVTDKELIEKTGGIVQGMSGSPIIQNGKLVGAVTHVFLNDATKGYGIYIDWMLGN